MTESLTLVGTLLQLVRHDGMSDATKWTRQDSVLDGAMGAGETHVMTTDQRVPDLKSRVFERVPANQTLSHFVLVPCVQINKRCNQRNPRSLYPTELFSQVKLLVCQIRPRIYDGKSLIQGSGSSLSFEPFDTRFDMYLTSTKINTGCVAHSSPLCPYTRVKQEGVFTQHSSAHFVAETIACVHKNAHLWLLKENFLP